MTAAATMTEKIRSGGYDEAFARLYGADQVEAQRERYAQAVAGFAATYGEDGAPLMLFSAPGRTEIGGNHTDHNHGRVLAGSVNLDVIAVARPVPGGVRVQSEGYRSEERR